MALSPSQLQQHLGTVVPVDEEVSLTFTVPSGMSTSNVPSQPVPTGPGPGTNTTSGKTDDHIIIFIYRYELTMISKLLYE